MAKEEKRKIKEAEAEAAEADAEKEDDEDEDPVGEEEDPEPEEEEDPEPEEEPEPEKEPEAEPEPEDDGAGDTKPSGPDPILVSQVAAIVKKEIEDEGKEKKETEIKLSGKKEKIDTKPKMEQQEIRKGRMDFKEAIRMSVTGTALIEGYEEVVLGILEDAKIDGPLGYEPFFEKGKLFVEKGSEKQAAKVLKQSKDINKVPKIVGETLEFQEFESLEDLEKVHQELATTEQVDVDGRRKGFREALRRLTYEKIQQLKKEGAAEFMAAASAAKREGKKKFKFGDPPKEYPVTIKVDIPLKGEQKEEVEINESNELQAIMALDDAGIKAEINRKGQVVIKKKDKKKAHIALEKSFKKGGWPTLKLEDVETLEDIETNSTADDLTNYVEMKMSAAAKKKKALWAKSAAGKKSLKKSAKRAKKVASGSIKINKAKGRAMAKARKKGGIRNEFELDEASNKKAMKKVADEIEAMADKGGAEAPALFSMASRLRDGKLPTGQKVSKKVSAIFKKHGIREEVQKPRTSYEIVSEARKRAAADKPKWEPEDSEPRLS
jgi:hypothetical protein